MMTSHRFCSRAVPASIASLGLVLLAACGNSNAIAPISPPTSATATQSDLAVFYDQQVHWGDCGDAECTQVKVPLDYANPEGEELSLAVTRLPAHGESLGSLFVNPGGPGGSGFDYAKSANANLSPALTEHFDVIGVDPRGVAKSDPVNCLTDAERDEIAATDLAGQSSDEARQLTAVGRLPAQGCASRANPVYTFMDTRSVARDFDIVRQVVGDASFNYLGKSYGTAIGTEYAALFPQRVGRMVLDGVLPTDLGLEEITKGQAAGFEEAFAHFVQDCSEHEDCPYRLAPAEVASKLRLFLRSLDTAPLKVRDRELNTSLATSAVLSYLYFPASDYPRLRAALDTAVNAHDGEALMALLDERTGREFDGRYVDNSSDSFYAVTCLDRQYQASTAQVSALARQWETWAPTFGAGLAWGLLPCANWPAKGAGPERQVNILGAAPILVLSTKHDPATPDAWGHALSKQIENSGLLQWDAYNHTAYEQGSSCIDTAVDLYLLRGDMPTANAVC